MIKIWVKQFHFPYFGADVKNVNKTLLSLVRSRPFLQKFIFANCGTNLNINPSPAFKGPFRTATAACIWRSGIRSSRALENFLSLCRNATISSRPQHICSLMWTSLYTGVTNAHGHSPQPRACRPPTCSLKTPIGSTHAQVEVETYLAW